MDWQRNRDAFIGAAITGAGIALGVLVIVALLFGFAELVQIVGDR